MNKSRKTIFSKSKKQFSERSKKELGVLILCCFIFMLVYFAAANITVPIISFIVTWLYMLGLAVFVIVYVVYNYAFSRKNITPEMLPNDWSIETKVEYIQKGQDRAKKSRWMIFVIFPLIVTFIADLIYLFVWQGWLHQMFSK